MDCSRWNNPVRNFVNLSKLYSRRCALHRLSKSNSGNPGWAYLEDGSVFFAHIEHTDLELQDIMKVAAGFMRNPTDGREMHREDRSNMKMILLD